MRRKPRIGLGWWLLWGLVLVLSDLVFYLLLAPVWIGLRGLAWVAEFRARRRQCGGDPCV